MTPKTKEAVRKALEDALEQGTALDPINADKQIRKSLALLDAESDGPVGMKTAEIIYAEHQDKFRLDDWYPWQHINLIKEIQQDALASAAAGTIVSSETPEPSEEICGGSILESTELASVFVEEDTPPVDADARELAMRITGLVAAWYWVEEMEMETTESKKAYGNRYGTKEDYVKTHSDPDEWGLEDLMKIIQAHTARKEIETEAKTIVNVINTIGYGTGHDAIIKKIWALLSNAVNPK